MNRNESPQTPPTPTTPPAEAKRRKRRGGIPRWVLLLAVLGASAAGVYAFRQASHSGGPPLALAPVVRGSLAITVSQSGTITNREKVTLRSEVPGRNMILYIIEEGVIVEPDTLLVELDATDLLERLTRQEIAVMNAEASAIRAEQDLAVTRSQGESNIRQAELNKQFAEDDLRKYINGDYPQELQRVRADIQLAESTRERALDKLTWSRRLADRGYITGNDLKADEASYERARLDLELARGRLALLEEYTYPRRIQELESNIEQTREALERQRLRAASDLVQAEVSVKARRSEYEREKQQLADIKERIEKCRIVAPIAGQVVYATTGQAGWHGNVDPLERGMEVRERQELIHLPTTASMLARIMIPEANLRKIRVGQPARVTIDALPDQVFFGEVHSIGLFPDAHSQRMNPDLKVYETSILIRSGTEGIRAGMSCNVEVLVQELDDALYVPIQAIVRHNGRSVAFVPDAAGQPVPVPVEVGLDNNRVIHVISGLEEGQQVLLNPPLPEGRDRSEEPRPPDIPEAMRNGVPAESPPSPPQAETAETEQAEGTPDLQAMTPEQREAMMRQMTPEQREQLRQMRQRSRPEGAEPGASDGPGAGAGPGAGMGERRGREQ